MPDNIIPIFYIGIKQINRPGAQAHSSGCSVVLNRLCCDLRKIVVADEIPDGTNMIDELLGA
jgi:hypothetical protein